MVAKSGKTTINQKKLDALKKRAEAWPDGKRAMLHDNASPGGAVRVYAGGRVTLGMNERFPLHPAHTAFREIAPYIDMNSLVPWRQKVREWRALIDRGIDPKIETARQRAAEKKKQIQTVAAVWDEFEKTHVATLAKADEAKRAGIWWKREFKDRVASEIQPWEIGQSITKLAAKTPAEARNRLGHLGGMYSWAIGTGGYGISINPVAALNPTKLIGAKKIRKRVLTDAELRDVWAACAGPAGIEALKEARRRDRTADPDAPLGYPYGPLFRLMILTGQRENEVAGARWSEIDIDKKLWTLPPDRMKSDRAHEVPLAPDALELLKSLPRFNGGDAVFTTSGGEKPVNGFSKAKARLDRASGVLEWVLHDLRRTMRTHLSALPVEDLVRELVIAHARPNLHQVYDQHLFQEEKRQALTLWERRLRGILSPKPPVDVADLTAARERRVA